MSRRTLAVLVPSLLLAASTLAGCLYYDQHGRLVPGPVSVSGVVAVGAPSLVLNEDPDEVWLIRGSGVYFLPRVSADVFFFGGRWYHHAGTRWYGSASVRGPWIAVGDDDVPSRVRSLPPGYRDSYKYRRVPFGQWKDRGYRWDDDRDDDRDDDHDRGRKRWKEND